MKCKLVCHFISYSIIKNDHGSKCHGRSFCRLNLLFIPTQFSTIIPSNSAMRFPPDSSERKIFVFLSPSERRFFLLFFIFLFLCVSQGVSLGVSLCVSLACCKSLIVTKCKCVVGCALLCVACCVVVGSVTVVVSSPSASS